jgi:hypothetical protein
MKKQLWSRGVPLVFAALALAAGCPNPAGEQQTAVYTVSGRIAADDDADLSAVTVRLLQNGAEAGAPVKAAQNGAFAFANVKKGNGYVVTASLAAFNPAESAPFNVTAPTTGIVLELNKTGYSVTGKAATDVPSGGDITKARVFLIKGGVYFGEPVAPDAAGNFEIKNVKPGNYAVRATLAGYDYAETAAFPVNGPQVISTTLVVSKAPPVLSKAVLQKSNEVTLTFNQPVMLTAAGFTVKSKAGSVIAITGVRGQGDEWVCTLAANVPSYEDIFLDYDAQTGAVVHAIEGRKVQSFQNVAVVKALSFRLDDISVNSPGVSLTFSGPAYDVSAAGFTFTPAVNVMRVLSPSNEIHFFLIPVLPAGDLFVSYDASVGTIKDAAGNPLASFSNRKVRR